jgi:two-component system nitrate/nitrite response regulator NarL
MTTDTLSHPIKVLLIDSHALFRSGIRSLLQRHAEFNVIGDASDGAEGLKRAKQLQPDVVLLDLDMPGISGLETLHQLKQDCPHMAVIMLTVSEEAEDLDTALRDGASGYLIKSIDAEFLVRAVRRVAWDEPAIAEAMTAKLVAH